jgi:hypothetical protein
LVSAPQAIELSCLVSGTSENEQLCSNRKEYIFRILWKFHSDAVLDPHTRYAALESLRKDIANSLTEQLMSFRTENEEALQKGLDIIRKEADMKFIDVCQLEEKFTQLEQRIAQLESSIEHVSRAASNVSVSCSHVFRLRN